MYYKLFVSDSSYWLTLGKNDINSALNVEKIEKTAKNVILFVGDGMGVTTTTASRIYSKTENGYLSFEKFPHIAVIKVSFQTNISKNTYLLNKPLMMSWSPLQTSLASIEIGA